MKDLRIIFMGTPDFATGVLQRMVEEGLQVVAVVTVADKPAGAWAEVARILCQEVCTLSADSGFAAYFP